MFSIFPIPPDAAEISEQMGTKFKFWYEDPRFGRTLFKEGRPGTGENWAEKLACDFASILGIPHAYYELAEWNGKSGVLSPSFAPKSGRRLMIMDTVFVAWQQPETNEWIPVARLDREHGKFRFSYTKGALRAKEFQPFGRMDDLTKSYESETLFPLFSNRLISKSRPEFKNYLRWLDLPDMSEDPMAILALTGGIRGTDDIELFRPPVVDPDGFLRLKFFARGIRHLSKEAIELIGTLKKGQQLFFSPDRQNAHDPFALALRSSEPPAFAGYCPKYYAKDLGHILNSPDAFLEARVQAVNLDAPLSMRLLCLVTGKVLENGASLHAGSDFNPINDTTPADWKGLNLELASL